jgi:microcompartment protein CcmK/EutM
MRLMAVLGTVTLSRAHPSLPTGRWLLGVPLSLTDLRQGQRGSGEEVVFFDDLGAGSGQLVGVTEGVEAAAPFHPERRPVDAYCACLLEKISLEENDRVQS